MQVNSALVILGAAQQSGPQQLQLQDKAAFEIVDASSDKTEGSQESSSKPDETYFNWLDLPEHAETKARWAAEAKIRDGEVHPLGEDKSLENAASEGLEDPRFLREGNFEHASGPLRGEAFVVRDAVMGDRQGALINAYHFGTDLMDANQRVAAESAVVASRNSEIASLKEQLAAGEGDSDYNSKKLALLQSGTQSYGESLQDAKMDADRAMASLSRMFSQTDNGLEGSVTATPTFDGFEITHGTYGKLMEVSADGEITMFDSEGKAYTREEFVEKQPDGMIGEMHNDLIREEDKRQWKAEREERHEKIRNGEIEGSWIIEVPDDYYI